MRSFAALLSAFALVVFTASAESSVSPGSETEVDPSPQHEAGAQRLAARQATRASVVRMAARGARLAARASIAANAPCGGYVGIPFILDVSDLGPSPYATVEAGRRGAIFLSLYTFTANTQATASRLTLTPECYLVDIASGNIASSPIQRPDETTPGVGIGFGPLILPAGSGARTTITCSVGVDQVLNCNGGFNARGTFNVFTGNGLTNSNSLALTADGALAAQQATFSSVKVTKPKVIQVDSSSDGAFRTANCDVRPLLNAYGVSDVR
ncbi:uncharacterized protein MKK02DRAFT_31334 [Dioszegia hungarica]|uniref:Uncharacterized protein n=1 Tax=Dioszegia hungarica TaxID=4972 RepID=A0AA38HCN8_9TREE|nr:uncharacterized protein MKK02DRAFT_31334 [Dioszegia hungarica]KAI9637758.1 hypothetical protein MKK02DRAFT_31334 [Dioszegia hungarica]